MESWTAKVISIVVAIILPMFFTLIPYPMSGFIERKGQAGVTIINRLMCFGGGIFFGTFLLHIGPETRNIMDAYLLDPNYITYPLTDFIIGLGFFFVLFLEKIVMKINKRRTQARKRRLQRNCAMFSEGVVCENCKIGQPCESISTTSTDPELGLSMNINSRISAQVAEIEECANEITVKPSNDDYCYDLAASFSSSDPTVIDNKPKSIDMSSASSHDHHSQQGHGHSHGFNPDNEASHHNMRSLILIMALSLHHLFEGLSLGLQGTVIQVFTLLLALMCHETVIGFSLGMQLIKCNYSLKRFVITAVSVSIIMPVGITIGTIMTEVGAGSDEIQIASGIVQAFACGTFIYVTFFEILQEEINPHDTSISKIACVAGGFMVISLLELIPEEGKSDAIVDALTTSSGLWSNYTTASNIASF